MIVDLHEAIALGHRIGRAIVRGLFVMLLLPIKVAVAQAPTSMATGLDLRGNFVPLVFFDGGYAYFPELPGSNWTIARVPLSGGTKSVVLTGAAVHHPNYWSGIASIDASATHFYISYGNYNESRVEEVTRDFTSRRLITVFSGGNVNAVFGSTIYLTRGFCCFERLDPAPGSNPVSIASNIWLRGDYRDGDAVYSSDVGTKNLYRYRPSTDQAPVALITGNPSEGVPHTNTTSAFSSSYGWLKRVAKSGGAITTMTVPSMGYTWGVDDTYLYYGVPSNGPILGLWRLRLDGQGTSGLDPVARTGLDLILKSG